MKKIITFCFLLLPVFFFSFTEGPTIIELIQKKMEIFHSERPQEKLYLQFDKPIYASGENVWLKAYVMEASFHHLDSSSRVIYVELIDKNNLIITRKVLMAKGGISYGDILLPDTLEQGKYLVRAYTNYMKNVGDDFFFKKEISVLNGNKKAANNTAESFNKDSIDLQFFPEGGNLVACGVPNRIAFKAIGPDGRSIDVEGEIFDESNNTIPFQSVHDGMGLVQINPNLGAQYFARITKPLGINHVYPLPPVFGKGFAIQVDEIEKNIRVKVFTSDHNPTIEKEQYLVVQSRGKIYYTQSIEKSSHATIFYLPQSKLPDGINHITLFNTDALPVAERLIHINKKESIKLKVRTDSPNYDKRTPVIVYLDALYQNGEPALGNFSISVYNHTLIKNEEEYPLTIQNYLSLCSDLRGYIENPGYYFKDSKPETKEHLDLLMMTHGWRRFKWQDVLKDHPSSQQFNHERGIPISGKVFKISGKNAPAQSIVKLMTTKGNIIAVNTDSAGRFYSDAFSYYDSMNFIIVTENKNKKKVPYKFKFDPLSPAPGFFYTPTSIERFEDSYYPKQRHERFSLSTDVTVLDEVQVSGKRDPDSRLIGAGRGNTIDATKLTAQGYSDIFQMIQSRVPNLFITGTPPQPVRLLSRNRDSSSSPNYFGFLVDGKTSLIDEIAMISPTDVESIEVTSNPAMYGNNLTINIIMKKGASSYSKLFSTGVTTAKYPGFNQAREFYSPHYNIRDNQHAQPDKRITLFWEPMLITDSNGRAAITFYTGDVDSDYQIVVEGITPDGCPGVSTTSFEVRSK